MTVKSEKMHGFASEMVFQCDERPRPGRALNERGHKATLRTSYESVGTVEYPISGNSHDKFEVRPTPAPRLLSVLAEGGDLVGPAVPMRVRRARMPSFGSRPH